MKTQTSTYNPKNQAPLQIELLLEAKMSEAADFLVYLQSLSVDVDVWKERLFSLYRCKNLQIQLSPEVHDL